MASIYDLKPAFQNLLRPGLKRLVDVGISPNQITLMALMLSAIGGVCVWEAIQWPFLLLAVPLILFVRMALNALDGMMAREYQMASPLGEILNEVGDIVSDTCLYLPFIVFAQGRIETILLICLFVILGLICEFSGVLAKSMIQVRRYDGPMGKSDRAFSIGLFSLLLFFWPPVIQMANVLFLLLNGLLLVSCYHRLKGILTTHANPS